MWERDVLSFCRFSSRAQIKEITLHLASFPIQDRRVFHVGAARSQSRSAEGVYLCCCSSGRQDVFYSLCVPRTPILFTLLRASSMLPCHSRGTIRFRFPIAQSASICEKTVPTKSSECSLETFMKLNCIYFAHIL